MFNRMLAQIRFVLLLVEAHVGDSMLQSFDALLRNDLFGAGLGLPLRTGLAVLLLLQVGLPAVDKRFSNGLSLIRMPSPSMDFGMFAAPGLAPTGNGLALAINAYLPFWSDPRLNTAYEYNLYALDNETAALLDTLDPLMIAEHQRGLSLGEYLTISANVNATVLRKALH